MFQKWISPRIPARRAFRFAHGLRRSLRGLVRAMYDYGAPPPPPRGRGAGRCRVHADDGGAVGGGGATGGGGGGGGGFGGGFVHGGGSADKEDVSPGKRVRP